MLMMEREGAGAGTAAAYTRGWMSHLSSLNYSPATLKAYGRDLASWFAHLARAGVDVDGADLETVEAWIASLKRQELATKTIKRRVTACKEFYRWARGRKLIADNPFADMGRMRQERRIPRFLELLQVEALIAAGAAISGRKSKSLALRNVAILELFYAAGCRLGELHQLDIKHVSLEAKTVLLYGKGRKERLVPIGKPCVEAIQAYLPIRAKALESKTRYFEQALFVSERGSRLSRDSIQEVVEKAGKRIGMQVHCHMLRHSYGTHMLERGAQLDQIQDLMGHEWIETTRGYTHTAVARLASVYEKAHPRA
jgi:site-specific recombinase XerD